MEIQLEWVLQEYTFHQLTWLELTAGPHLTAQLIKYLAHDRDVRSENILKLERMAENIA